ncbi:FG-GAP-like repeat-containing protein [Streptomyces sp. KL110A]|uniref:FG-GAP-like repeat-containing protein n=1 Tax=Streptomyces sp. KL110A TaxID=3384221 RepID=UPI0038BF9CA6
MALPLPFRPPTERTVVNARLRRHAAAAVLTAAAVTGALLTAPAAVAAPAPTPSATGQAAAEVPVVTREEMPTVIDFDEPGDRASMVWEFDRPVTVEDFTLYHDTESHMWALGNTGELSSSHRFELASYTPKRMSPLAGEYTWRMLAYDAAGNSVERTGSFTLNRQPAPRDYDANSVPDVLIQSADGRMTAYDTEWLRRLHADWRGPWYEFPIGLSGPDWRQYTLTAAPGDLGGSGSPDVVARDGDGVLWLHQGEGQEFLPPTKIGGGWQVYNKITGGSDLNADGRGDLLARDTAGVLWFYASTGDARAPFKPRVKIGGGWQIYNQITAPGNIAGATGGDLLARDKDGVLWLYLGKGDGTFTARRQIGGGWQRFTHVAGLGDQNGDGRVDLFAIGTAGSRYYPTTGLVDAPYGTPKELDLDNPDGKYVNVL